MSGTTSRFTISGRTSAQFPTRPTDTACFFLRACSIRFSASSSDSRDLVAITARQSLLDSRAIDFDAKEKRAIHCRGQRLRATHSAEAAGNNKLSFERTAKMFHPGSGESFERSLHDSLAADVNPRARRHLAIHR